VAILFLGCSRYANDEDPRGRSLVRWGSNLYGHNKKKKRELKEELTNIEALE
jgi:hypothetical protein